MTFYESQSIRDVKTETLVKVLLLILIIVFDSVTCMPVYAWWDPGLCIIAGKFLQAFVN